MAGPRTAKKGKRAAGKSSGGAFASLFKIGAWWAFNVAVWTSFILILAGGLYAFSVDRGLRDKFEGNRWKLPSHVYSDSLTVLPGDLLSTTGLIERLKRLNYQEKDTATERPGQYHRGTGTLEIYLNRFDYPGEARPARLVKMLLGGEAVTKIFDAKTGEELFMLEVEPELISRFFGQVQEERRIIPYEAIPKSLVWSVVAVEDAAFFEHHGINFKGITRAVVKGILRFSFREGGSSITQQLVKNLYLSPERTISRKLKEAVMAIVLEMHYPKEKIFEVYINEIYFGQSGSVSICGLGEAAKFYFGKDAEDMTLAESSLLAGLIRSPAGYNPRKHVERAKIRRDYILDRLAKMPQAIQELGVTVQDLDDAKLQDLVVSRHLPPSTIAPYFIAFLRQQLNRTYGEDVLQSVGLRIFTTLDAAAQQNAEGAVDRTLKELETNNKRLQVTDNNRLQAALVVLEPSTGYVRAMVGGRNFVESPFNRAVQMQRQVGSTFKPIVYTAAFHRAFEERGFEFTPATIIEDKPLSITSGGQKWKPNNFDHKFEGNITARHALEQSRNVPTARVGLMVGIDNVIRTARDMGVTADLPPYPALSLGIAEMSPLELASVYATLANQGYYNAPIAIRDVVDQTGAVLEKRSVKPRRAVPPQVAYLTTHILEGAINRGTGAGVRRLGLKIAAAGKTGTTNDAKDAWFVGYTPNILAAVWVGFDTDRNVGLTGGRAALPIWTRFMLDFTRGKDVGRFETPPGIVFRKTCQKSGLLAHYNSPDVVDEAFVEGTEPTEESRLFRDEVLDFFKKRK
ncbi:MAG: PBP1A family penicillin-binding protein [Candidatus Lernaella stagnicola]|nr:PBP1A family penicillin-binding protein [Candidatus Lernaella stagnicola]